MPVKPDDIKDRMTISLPNETDRFILCAIMNQHGLGQSASVRVALRDYARSHGILPESLVAHPSTAPATTSATRQAG